MSNEYLDFSDAFDIENETGNFVELPPRKIRVSKDPEEFVTFPNPFQGDIFAMEPVIAFLQKVMLLSVKQHEKQRLAQLNGHKSKGNAIDMSDAIDVLETFDVKEVLFVLRRWAGDDEIAKLQARGLTLKQLQTLLADLAQYFAEGLTAVGDSKN